MAVLGGAKISTKLDLINSLCDKMDTVILGGGIANTCLLAQGFSVGDSLVEERMLKEALELSKKSNVISSVPSSFTKKVLIEEFTGAWCQFCPDGAYILGNIINANNKMIARLSALRYILNTLEYDEKQTLEPPKWGEDLGQYSCYIEGILFDNLNYEQYKILSPFSD